MRILCCLAAALITIMPAQAHEFWISPEKYMIDPAGQLVAHIRVGQQFSGSSYSYLRNGFVRFDIVAEDEVLPVEGRMGDRPALSMTAPGDGLAVIVHQTTDYFLTYSEAEKFRSFVTDKGYPQLIEEHADRGLPETGFRERYSRYAKSLIAVGSGDGADEAVGMTTEIVALANPYTDDLSNGFPVSVLYRGEPRRNAQVDLFEKDPDGGVTLTKYRTDGDGTAVLPVRSGYEYLVDAGLLRALEPEDERSPVWESLWASLTFQVPAS